MPQINFLANDPLSWENLLNQQQQVQQQAAQGVAQGDRLNLPPLSDQQENSLLSSIGQKTLGGIGYVGSLLDKYTGGRAVRGLLGGHPEELLSLLPGSDALGITDEANRVSGRDLTDNLGLTTRGGDGFGDTALGIGAEILTNPTTYVTGPLGTLTHAGEQAAKIGFRPGLMQGLRGINSTAELGPQALAAAARVGIDPNTLVGTPLRGLASVGLPFGPKAVFGTGAETADSLASLGQTAKQTARTIADLPGINTITHPIESIYNKVAEPMGRQLQALFNYKVAGATSAAGQKAGREYTAGVQSGLEAARGAQVGAVRNLAGADALDQGALVRNIAEAPTGAASPLTPQGKAINQEVDAMKAYLDQLRAEGHSLGFVPHELSDTEAQYFPRHMQELDKDSRGFAGRQKQFNTNPSALEGREDILKNVPGGTQTLNQLTMDADVSGINGRFGPANLRPNGQAPTSPLQREAMIRERYLGVTPQDEAMIGPTLAKASQGQPLTPEESLLISRWKQSQGLARWAESLDPQYAQKGIPFFGRNPVDDFMSTAASTIRRNEAGKAIHGMFADAAVPAAEAGPNYVPLGKALKLAGFDDEANALQAFAARKGIQGNPASAAVDLYVPPELAKDATKFTQGFQTPEVLKPLLGAVDWFTNLTKTFQTSPFPAFHLRNFVSGQYSNWMLDAFDPRYGKANPLGWIKPVQDAIQVIKGGVVEGAKDMPIFKGMGLTDAEATKRLADLAYQYRAAGNGVSLASEGLTGGDQAASLVSKIPGLKPFEGFGATLKQAIPNSKESLNPLNVAGVSSNKDLFAPVVAGRKIGDATEEINRLSAFIGQLRQGYDPATAAMRTRAAHVDYSALSPFEKNVMRRLVPFYSYTRGIVPFVMDNLVKNPGGLGGHTAMAAYSLRQQNKGFVPDWMGNGLAIPIGDEQNGTQRFLTKVDNPVEAAASIYNGGGLDKTAMGVLGMMNPLVKAPLEFATGKQFFTGRDLADLYPMTGSNLTDQILVNSPLSRLATTYRTLTDERKLEDPLALLTNLGTGVKLSDIDMEKQRDLAAREFISESLRGQQGIGRYETIYPRPEAIGSLTPEEIALLRLNKSLEMKAQKRAKEAKQKIGVRGG